MVTAQNYLLAHEDHFITYKTMQRSLHYSKYHSLYLRMKTAVWMASILVALWHMMCVAQRAYMG